MIKLPTQITGNIGLYHVCYRLSKMGWNVLPTSRNTRGVDIICFNMAGDRTISLQVKTLTRKDPVVIGNSLDKVVGDYWVVVNMVGTNNPCTYILFPDEIRSLSHKSEPPKKPLRWVTPKKYMQAKFYEKWGRIGFGIPDLEKAGILDGDEWFEETMREERNSCK